MPAPGTVLRKLSLSISLKLDQLSQTWLRATSPKPLPSLCSAKALAPHCGLMGPQVPLPLPAQPAAQTPGSGHFCGKTQSIYPNPTPTGDDPTCFKGQVPHLNKKKKKNCRLREVVQRLKNSLCVVEMFYFNHSN